MKKLSAILLIAVFLFNLFGYRLMFNYAQKQADTHLEASLDKNDFNEAELVTLKVSISVPYQITQASFERVDGEIKIDGKIYKYVKRKVVDGQLILMCLPDHKKMQLQTAKNDFFKYSNDLVQNNTSKKSDNSKTGVFKNLTGEYDHYPASFTHPHSVNNTLFRFAKPVNYFPSSPHASPEQPPELI